jgi:hypothetical protein
MLKLNPQSGGNIRRWGLWGVIMRLVLYKRDLRELLALFAFLPRKDTVRRYLL